MLLGIDEKCLRESGWRREQLMVKHVAGDLVCALRYSDYGPIDARHNLFSDMLYVSSRFESIYYFGAWPIRSPMWRRESILLADLISDRMEGTRAQQT